MLRVVRLRTIAAACAALSGVTLAVAVAGMRSAAPPPGPPPAMPLWVDPDSQAARAARALAATRPDDAAALEWLARRPQATWLGPWLGSASGLAAHARRTVAAATDSRALATLVLYALPARSCHFEARDQELARSYRARVRALADAVGRRPALIVVEPDAVAEWRCLPPAQRAQRIALLRYAVARLTALPAARVYLDAGHPSWQPASAMARRLARIWSPGLRGVALNVANFQPTARVVAYGRAILARLAHLQGERSCRRPAASACRRFVEKRFGLLVDTSRNGGRTPRGESCNPRGVAVGEPPRLLPPLAGVDGLLWIKGPGSSDGSCNGGPPGGVFWVEYALELVRNSPWFKRGAAG